jgi:hypothetical protein
MFEFSLPSIHINHKIYIPMLDTIFTKENIMNLSDLNYSNKKK